MNIFIGSFFVILILGAICKKICNGKKMFCIGSGTIYFLVAALRSSYVGGDSFNYRRMFELLADKNIKFAFAYSEKDPIFNVLLIGIRHGEKMYETLLTNEECANAVDMGKFYRVPCDKRDLNYDKYFKDGDKERNTLTEFNSSNTELLNVEQVKEKLLSLAYIREELEMWQKEQGK